MIVMKHTDIRTNGDKPMNLQPHEQVCAAAIWWAAMIFTAVFWTCVGLAVWRFFG